MNAAMRFLPERPFFKHWSDWLLAAALIATIIKVYWWGFGSWLWLHVQGGVWRNAVEFFSPF